MIYVLLLLSLTAHASSASTDYKGHPIWNIIGLEPRLRRAWYESVKKDFTQADKYQSILLDVAQKQERDKEHHTLRDLVAIAHKELHAQLHAEGVIPTSNLLGAVVWQSMQARIKIPHLAWCLFALDARGANLLFYDQGIIADRGAPAILEEFLPLYLPSHCVRAATWLVYHNPSSAIQARSEAQYQEKLTRVVSAVPPCLPQSIAQFIAKYAVPYGLTVTDAVQLHVPLPPNQAAQLNLVSLDGLEHFPRDEKSKDFHMSDNLISDIAPQHLLCLNGSAAKGVVTIQNLFLDRNNMATIPNGTFSALSLQTLCIRRNYLRSIGHNAFPCSLTRLDLSCNQLKELPDRPFAQLNSLVTLALDHNHLEDLNDALFGLTSLMYLDLNHNRLTQLGRNTLALAPRLKNLSVAYNRLQNVPGDFSSLEHLTDVYMVGNNISDAEKEALRKQWKGNQAALKIELADDHSNHWYTPEEFAQA